MEHIPYKPAIKSSMYVEACNRADYAYVGIVLGGFQYNPNI